MVKNYQDNDFNENKLTKLDQITVNRNPILNNELASKEYVDDTMGENIFLGFNQTLENYLTLSVGTDIRILTKYDKIQITDTTVIKHPNTGGYLLQIWAMNCNDKII